MSRKHERNRNIGCTVCNELEEWLAKRMKTNLATVEYVEFIVSAMLDRVCWNSHRLFTHLALIHVARTLIEV